MLTAILLGLAGGFVLSIPPGPLSIAVTKQGVEGRFLPGFKVALGAALMDIVYMLIATFTSSAIVVALTSLITGSQWLPLAFQLLCIGVLLFMGIRYLKSEYCKEATNLSTRRQLAQEQKAKALGRSSPLFLGVLIALTNLATPTFLPSMIAFVGYFHANGGLQQGALNSAAFSIAFGLGTAIWFFFFLRILIRFRRKLSDTFITSIYRFAGGTFILFAAIIAYNVVTTTEWSGLL